MRLLELREQEDTEALALSLEEYAALAKIDRLNVRPSCADPSLYDIDPGSWVGQLDLTSMTLRVVPKLPIARVLFLWSYALDPKNWRDEYTCYPEAADLVEALAQMFASALDAALRRGALEGYRLVEESAKTVRGRILMREQWANSLRLRAEVAAYDEFTPDILENRLLKAAIGRIRRIRIADAPVRRKLAHFAQMLADVADQAFIAGRIPDIHYTHLNRHYERAIFFARMILSAQSFELGEGEVRARGFLINMNEVFERFVRAALREALHEPASRFGKGVLWFDEDNRKEIKPDLLWSLHGRRAFVGDVKYQRIIADAMPHADLYQMLAYIVAAGLRAGMLIYPQGEAEETSLRVAGVGCTIETRTLHISGDPGRILDSVGELAERVRAMAGAA